MRSHKKEAERENLCNSKLVLKNSERQKISISIQPNGLSSTYEAASTAFL